MLINSVIIVLREVLEASLMTSLLLALSYILKIRTKWFLAAISLGIIGAAVYAYYLTSVSQWLDGTGQEIVNASMQYLIYGLLLFIICLIVSDNYTLAGLPVLPIAMAVTVGLSIAREGSEIIIYVYSFIVSTELIGNILVGSLFGAGIGVSVGALFYYAIVSRETRTVMVTALILLSLVAGGMISQATQLLVQADWLPSTQPVWDFSTVIAETSVVGQLLYALIGYEATPSLIQVIFYTFSLIVIAVVVGVIYFRKLQSMRRRLFDANDS